MEVAFGCSTPVVLRQRVSLSRSVRNLAGRLNPYPTMAAGSVYGMNDVIRKGGYKGVILDQFGVVHDGRNPYPNAVSTLNALKDTGVHIIILSNSSRRADHASRKLREMGCGDLRVITSGELARNLLRGDDSPIRECSTTVHTNWLERGAVDPVDAAIRTPWVSMVPPGCESHVDSVVMHGTEGVSTASGDVEPVEWERLKYFFYSLGRCRPTIPVVCVNPDVVTVDAGILRNMPGALAGEYERGGGSSVLRVGKPGTLAYVAALTLLSEQGILAEEVVCVGDSVAHDIRGALEMSPALDCVYIAGGINAETFALDFAGVRGANDDWTIDWNIWDKIVEEDSPGCGRPTYAMPYFRW